MSYVGMGFTPTFSPAIRERWGYHDALLHAKLGICAEWRKGPRDKHFDKAYVRGYYAGMDAIALAKGEAQ